MDDPITWQDYFDGIKIAMPGCMLFALFVVHWVAPHDWVAKVGIAAVFGIIMAPLFLPWRYILLAFPGIAAFFIIFPRWLQNRDDRNNPAWMQLADVKRSLKQLKKLQPRTPEIKQKIAQVKTDLARLRQLPTDLQGVYEQNRAQYVASEADRLGKESAQATKEALTVQAARIEAAHQLRRQIH